MRPSRQSETLPAELPNLVNHIITKSTLKYYPIKLPIHTATTAAQAWGWIDLDGYKFKTIVLFKAHVLGVFPSGT
jgi:hypothetical protein